MSPVRVIRQVFSGVDVQTHRRLLLLCTSVVTIWTVYMLISPSSSLNQWNYFHKGDEKQPPPCRQYEQYELAPYNVERIMAQYLTYVRGELQSVMTNMTKHGKIVTIATNELSNLTGERSRAELGRDVRNGRIKQSFTSLWRQINRRLTLVNNMGANSSVLGRLIEDTDELGSILEKDLDILSNSNSSISDDWKVDASRRLGKLVQSKIYTLQFPVNCKRSRLAYCEWLHGCSNGFGCHVHQVTYCLLMAFSLNRTLVFDTRGWPYPGTWDTWFRPLSSCNVADVKGRAWRDSSGEEIDKDRVVEIKWRDHQKVRPEQGPLAIPEKIADEIQQFNRYPPIWWIGQFVDYVLRPNNKLSNLLDSHMLAIGFKPPIVGVHVRRTDKLREEAQSVPLDHYMAYVTKWYDELEMTSPYVIRRVFLATDELSVAEEAVSNYPGYKFIQTGYKLNTEVSNRVTLDGWRSIIMDIFSLSRANYTVCTLSSNVGRLVYEMMQQGRGDGSHLVQSMDEYYFYTNGDWVRGKVIVPHKAIRPGERDLNVGDQIDMLTHHLNGYSSGKLCKTGQYVTFPTYKVRDIFRKVNFPVSFHGAR